MNWNEAQSEIRAAVAAWLNRAQPNIQDSLDFIVPEFSFASFSLLIEEVSRRDASLAFDIGHFFLRREQKTPDTSEPWPVLFPSERRLAFVSSRIHSLAGHETARSIPGLAQLRVYFMESPSPAIEASRSTYLFWSSWLAGILVQIAAETLLYAEQRYQGGRLIKDWSEHRVRLHQLCSETQGLCWALDQLRSLDDLRVDEIQSLTFRFAHRAETLASDALSLFGGAGYMREYPIAERFAFLTCFVPTLRADPRLTVFSAESYRRIIQPR